MPEIVWPSAILKVIGARPHSQSTDIEAHTIRLFEELRIPLLRYLAGIGIPAADGEDVLQEAFLALFRHLSDGKPQDNLRAWLYRVVRNLGLKHLERNPPQVEANLDSLAAEEEFNPEAAAVRRQQTKTVRAVIAALPDLDRHVLLLRGQGLRYRDIALVVEVSVGTVAQSLARTLDRLNRALKKF